MSKLKELLAAMGNTPEEVYETVKQAGIKATPNMRNRCAVAKYINHSEVTWPGIYVVNYKYDNSKAYGRAYIDDPQIMCDVSLPDPVAEFACRFDEYLYPDLIEK